MRNQIVNLLVFLLKTEGKKCPPEKFFPLNEKKLLEIARKNKVLPYLFHFLGCSSCKKKITVKTIKTIVAYQKFTSLWPFLYQEEKRKLNNFCRRKKIKCVLLKDFSDYPKMEMHQKYLLGTDLDLLIKKEDLVKIELFLKEKDYQLKEHLVLEEKGFHYEEKNYVHPHKKLSIDLHPYLAIPHSDEFDFLSPPVIKNLGEEIFLNSSTSWTGKNNQKNFGLFIPHLNYFLISLIIHHINTNLLRGLRNLFDIVKLAELYGQEINWDDFLSLSQKFKIKNFSLFLFLTGAQIFGIKMPPNIRIKTKLPLKISFFLPYWSPEKIALFPSTEKWSTKNRAAQKIFIENFFLKFFLCDSVPFKRMFRPKIILFSLKILLSWFNKFVALLYQKFSG